MNTPLQTGAKIPLKRCLAFHACWSRYQAVKFNSWIRAEEFDPIPLEAWSPDMKETPQLKCQIESWLLNAG